MTVDAETPSRLKRFLPLVLIAGALAAFFAFHLDYYFTLDTLRENREALNAWVEANPVAAPALFILAYAAAVTISFPGASILTVFGGFLFGLSIGVPAIVFAATIGATTVFVAARGALGGSLKGRVSGFLSQMEKGFRENELSYMFVLRLAPVVPFWAVNIAAGLVGVSLRNFVIGTALGIIPGSFVYASIGNAAGAAFDRGESVSLSGIFLQRETLIPIIGLILLSLIPIVIKNFRKKAQDE